MDINYTKNKEIINHLKDKYGLIPATAIVLDENEGRWRLKDFADVFIFPHTLITNIVDFLFEEKFLWKQSAFSVSALPPVIARAPIFGVPLKRAFDEALKKGLQKNRFALIQDSYDPVKGYAADLLIFVANDRKNKTDIREVQIWESVRDSEEIFYGHAILDASKNVVHHLDCATIYMNQEDKKYLFYNSTKVKGEIKEKHFRVDGEFPLLTALELMRLYFPVEELLNEAFEMEKYSNGRFMKEVLR